MDGPNVKVQFELENLATVTVGDPEEPDVVVRVRMSASGGASDFEEAAARANQIVRAVRKHTAPTTSGRHVELRIRKDSPWEAIIMGMVARGLLADEGDGRPPWKVEARIDLWKAEAG